MQVGERSGTLILCVADLPFSFNVTVTLFKSHLGGNKWQFLGYTLKRGRPSHCLKGIFREKFTQISWLALLLGGPWGWSSVPSF